VQDELFRHRPGIGSWRLSSPGLRATDVGG